MAVELFIRTTKAEYVGGDPLCGAVYLKVHGPTAAFGIWVRFYGFEKFSFNCVVSNSSSVVRGHGSDLVCNTDHHVDSDRISLYEFDGSIALGQYIFPFSLQLPDDLPASTEVIWSNGRAEVCYHVEASLMGAENVVTSQKVCVKQPSAARSLAQDSESELAVAGGQVLPEHKVVELRTQLPFVTAHLTITASLDKLEYHAGEVMKLRLRVDCPSAIKPRISHLSLQLLRETRLSLDNLSPVHRSLVGCAQSRWSSSFGSLVPRITNGTAPGENCFFPEQHDDGSAVVVWDSGHVYDRDGSILIKGFNELLVPLKGPYAPRRIPATTIGHTVTVLYTLKIEFSFVRNNPVVMNLPVCCIWQNNSEWQQWKPAVWMDDCQIMLSMEPRCHVAPQAESSELSSLPGLHVLHACRQPSPASSHH